MNFNATLILSRAVLDVIKDRWTGENDWRTSFTLLYTYGAVVTVTFKTGVKPMLELILKKKGEIVGDRFITIEDGVIYPSSFWVEEDNSGLKYHVQICVKEEHNEEVEYISPLEDQIGNRIIAYQKKLPSGKSIITDKGFLYWASHELYPKKVEERRMIMEQILKSYGVQWSENGKHCYAEVMNDQVEEVLQKFITGIQAAGRALGQL